MTELDSKTLETIHGLISDVDGFYGANIYLANEHSPKGELQDCDFAGVSKEWVDQSGPGFSGDDFHGTITWKLGDYYLVAGFNT